MTQDVDPPRRYYLNKEWHGGQKDLTGPDTGNPVRLAEFALFAET
jgi:hypothetical protein